MKPAFLLATLVMCLSPLVVTAQDPLPGLGVGYSADRVAGREAGESVTLWYTAHCKDPGIAHVAAAQCQVLELPTIVLTSGEGDAELDELFPVRLLCPAENGGVMELVRRNRRNQFFRVRVWFDRANNPVRGIIDLANPPLHPAYFDDRQFNVESFRTDDDLRYGPPIREEAIGLMRGVCLGSSPERNRYLSTLDNNAAYFRGLFPGPEPR